MSHSPLHVVIPCYNPPPGWAGTLVARMSELQHKVSPHELRMVVVNDGSSRGVSPSDVELLRASFTDTRWLEHPANKGKGAALRTGVSAAEGSLVLFTDVDVPYTVECMTAAAQRLFAGSDVVLGQRANTYYERVPPVRVAISKLFRFVLKRVLGFAITDTQCGLKGFNARGARLFLSTTVDRFLFDMEFVMLASREKDMHITTVDARLNEGVTFTRMNLGILLREGVNFLGLLLRSTRRG